MDRQAPNQKLPILPPVAVLKLPTQPKNSDPLRRPNIPVDRDKASIVRVISPGAPAPAPAPASLLPPVLAKGVLPLAPAPVKRVISPVPVPAPAPAPVKAVLPPAPVKRVISPVPVKAVLPPPPAPAKAVLPPPPALAKAVLPPPPALAKAVLPPPPVKRVISPVSVKGVLPPLPAKGVVPIAPAKPVLPRIAGKKIPEPRTASVVTTLGGRNTISVTTLETGHPLKKKVPHVKNDRVILPQGTLSVTDTAPPEADEMTVGKLSNKDIAEINREAHNKELLNKLDPEILARSHGKASRKYEVYDLNRLKPVAVALGIKSTDKPSIVSQLLEMMKQIFPEKFKPSADE